MAQGFARGVSHSGAEEDPWTKTSCALLDFPPTRQTIDSYDGCNCSRLRKPQKHNLLRFLLRTPSTPDYHLIN